MIFLVVQPFLWWGWGLVLRDFVVLELIGKRAYLTITSERLCVLPDLSVRVEDIKQLVLVETKTTSGYSDSYSYDLEVAVTGTGGFVFSLDYLEMPAKDVYKLVKKHLKIPCPRCAGKGKVEVGLGVDGSSGVTIESCKLCKGVGSLGTE